MKALRKRIVLTANYSPWSPYSGGGQRSTHYLAVELAKLGHDVHVIFSRAPFDRITVPDSLPYTLHWALLWRHRTSRRAFFRPVTAFSVNRIARSLCRSTQLPVVIHANGEEGWRLPSLRNRSKFLLAATPRYSSYPDLLRGWPNLPPERRIRLFLKEWKHLCQAKLLANADLVCPPSRWAAAEVIAHFGLDSGIVHTVHNGAPHSFFEVRRSPEADSGPLVYFGRLSRDKGVDLLIRACALLENLPPLLIIGDGEKKNEYERLAATVAPDHDIRFLSWKSHRELAIILARAQLSIVPSRHENCSLSILASLAAGVPTLSTHVGGTPELIEDGVSGRLVEAGNSSALAAAIRELLANREERRRLGEAGASRAAAGFSWERAARRLDQLYCLSLPSRYAKKIS